MNKPFITVYITSYNREDLIVRAINSVLNQTYDHFELIIVDDCSTDRTVENIKSCIRGFSNVRLLINEKNRGACYSRNLAIKESRGEYITGLDDDDAFSISRLQVFVNNIDEKYSFLCTPLKVISKSMDYKAQNKTGVISLDDMKNCNCIGNQIFVKKKLLVQTGGFDESFPAWQDYELFFRLLLKFGKAYKIKTYTYLHYIDHEYGRITNPVKINDAYDKFIVKHNNELSKENLNSLLFTKLLTQRASIPFSVLFKRVSSCDLRVFKYFLLKIRSV
ncbi:glycosyltransferase [Photobacterium sp. Alg240-V54]|uniref:glycosyltransferase n=1 Tax=Photobacterium sp. Alg240-V54 TaxID=2305995 RepID=UPI0013D538FC|nr:glycosyltransferase [Photobacterium sp. Alg240-V54]